jgi:26S proteasome regulatory subunit N8
VYTDASQISLAKQDGTATQLSFAHIPSSVEAEEAEEIGVEHLLRDIKSPHQFGGLSNRVSAQIASLKGLHSRLIEIRDYLALVGKGKLPVNHQIMYNLQDIFNLLPDLDGSAREAEIKRTAFRVETNDQSLVVYLSSLIRSVLALHDLSEYIVVIVAEPIS